MGLGPTGRGILDKVNSAKLAVRRRVGKPRPLGSGKRGLALLVQEARVEGLALVAEAAPSTPGPAHWRGHVWALPGCRWEHTCSPDSQGCWNPGVLGVSEGKRFLPRLRVCSRNCLKIVLSRESCLVVEIDPGRFTWL